MGALLPFDADSRPTRRRGSNERAVQDTLRAWRPWLTGHAHAGTRIVLLGAARNLDHAIAAGDSAYVIGQLTRWLNELLTLHAPPADTSDDDDLDPDPAGGQ